MVFKGGLAGLKTRTGIVLAAFVCWMVLISPLDYWALGSLIYVKDYVSLMVTLFLCIAAGPQSIRAERNLLRILAVSCIGTIVVSTAGIGARVGAASGYLR